MSNLINVNGVTSEPAPFGKPVVFARTAEDVRQESLTRQEQARRALEAINIVAPKTIVPEGSALIPYGEAKVQRDRDAWARMPLASTALPVVIDALRSEQRKDYTETVRNLRLRASDGRLVRSANVNSDAATVTGLAYTDHALRQLLGQAGILTNAPKGFAAALAYVDNAERAMIVNRLILGADPEKETVLRTKLPHEGKARIVRAALSERYADANDVDLAMILQGIDLPEGSRLSYMPGDSASCFRVIFPSLIPVDAIRAGDMHRAGLDAYNSETGQGGADILAYIERILCVNATLGTAYGESTSIRHVGAEARVHARIRQAMRDAVNMLEPLLETIGYSAHVPLGDWTVTAALASIAARFGEGKAASEAWERQHKAGAYPETVWGLTSAITEAAHERDSWTASEDWERVGSWVTDGAVKAARKGQTWDEILKVRGEESRDAQRRSMLARQSN